MPQDAVLKRHNAVLTTLAKNFFGSSPRSFDSKSENDKKVFVAKGRKMHPKMFLSSHEKRFWQPFRKLLAQKVTSKQKPFDFVPENFPKLYLWTRRMKFWQQCEKVFTRVNWVSAQSPKKMNRKKIKINPLSLKTQLVFVLRRKKLAKFNIVLTEQSLFEVLPLTHSDHNILPFRSVFFCQKTGNFLLNVR